MKILIYHIVTIKVHICTYRDKLRWNYQQRVYDNAYNSLSPTIQNVYQQNELKIVHINMYKYESGEREFLIFYRCVFKNRN